MQYSGLILIMTLVIASVTSTQFYNCSEGVPPVQVRLKNCSSIPCTAFLGAEVSGEMDFIAPIEIKKLKPEVVARAYGFPLDIPIPQENGCETLTSGKCPLKAGDNATYAFSMTLSEDDYSPYVGIKADIEFSFLDAKNATIICAKVPAIIDEH